MLVGVPKEIKNHEYRVGLTPSSVREIVNRGHQVLVQRNAGFEIDLGDEQYQSVGAEIVDTAEEIYARAEMIVKVKEPQPAELAMLREDQILFTYLHLAPDPEQARGLMESGCVAIAYETVSDERGRLPLLAPMSEVAGRMSIQAGAHGLEMNQGGRGTLLGGVPGVGSAKVTVIGGGVVGTNAARMAMGMEAHVTVLDKSVQRLQDLDFQFGAKLNTVLSNAHSLEEHVLEADLVVGAVLVPGAAAPKLVPRDMISRMKRGSVVVDVAIDQGGCFETARATTHADPIYTVDEVVHYCVANMPGAVARTSTLALNNVTLPFVLDLADKGVQRALADDPHLRDGLNVYRGELTYEAVAQALGEPYIDAADALAA